MTEPHTVALEVRDLAVGYHEAPILTHVTARWALGVHLLLGANGSGKSTFLRTLAGVIPPLEGTACIVGGDPWRTPRLKRQIGYLAHQNGWVPRLTVYQHLDFWARVHGLTASDRASRIGFVTETYQLQDFVHKPVSHLSQGQLQRARLGAVLLPDPRVLLLDEPTAGLDEETREHIFALLMRERSRRIVLLSTHIPHDVAVPVDSVARVASGTIGMDANPDNEGEPF